MPSKKQNYLSNFLLIAITAVAAVLNLIRMFDNNFWGDEAFSILLVRESFSKIVELTAADVHPPLYYFILKSACHIAGHSPLVYHFVSLIPLFILLLFSVTYIRKHFGNFTASLFNLLIGLTSIALRYNVEVRMYSWCMLFLFFTMYTVLRIILTPPSAYIPSIRHKLLLWSSLFLNGILGAYTHYYVLISVALIYIFLGIHLYFCHRKNDLKNWIICVALSSVLYAPWLLVLFNNLRQISGGYWIESSPPLSLLLRTLIPCTCHGVSGLALSSLSLVIPNHFKAYAFFARKGQTNHLIRSFRHCTLYLYVFWCFPNRYSCIALIPSGIRDTLSVSL